MFAMIGSGKTLYHFTYIDDLIDGFLLASTESRACGEVFTIGGATHTTVKDFVNDIADVLGKGRPKLRIPVWPIEAAAVACVALCKPFGINPPLYPRRLEFFTLDRSFTIAKARSLLGYDRRCRCAKG